MDVDIKGYFQPLIKWWWVLVAAVILASLSSYIISRQQPPIYQAHTTLMIGQTINSPNPAQTQFYLEQQLAQIYAGMAMRQPIQEGTMKALGLSFLPTYRVIAIPNSQLIDILVTDTNPVRAQAVAIELGNQMMLHSPTVGQEDQTRQEFINVQLDNLQTQIKETQAQVQKLKEDIGTMNSARQISDAQSNITALENKLSVLQANYATLLGNTKQGAPNSLSVVEPAELPTVPVGPNRMLTVLLSAVIGLGVASLGVYAVEFFDPTFRNTNEVRRTLQIPVLGQISAIPESDDVLNYVAKKPLSPTADAFRLMKNSLETAGLGTSLRILQIVSSEPSEGKTTVAINLATTIAKSGKRVILVDVDLRKLTLTKQMDLQDRRGLSDVLDSSVELHSVITPSTVENLYYLPAGKFEEDSNRLLDSPKMQEVLDQLEKYADIAILDSTPAGVPDAMELARRTKQVLFVVRIGRSRRETVKQVKEQFALANIPIIGVVLNGVPQNETYYSRYTSYYHIGTSTKTAGSYNRILKRIQAMLPSSRNGRMDKKHPENKETQKKEGANI